MGHAAEESREEDANPVGEQYSYSAPADEHSQPPLLISTDDEDDMAEPQIVEDTRKNINIELATSNRSKCQRCKSRIPMGGARIYKLVWNFTSGKDYMKKCFHVECFFETFSRARVTNSVIKSTSELSDFSIMPVEVQNLVEEQLAAHVQSIKPNLRDPNACKPKLHHGNAVQSKLISNLRRGTKPLLQSSFKDGIKFLYTNADVLTASKMVELRMRVAIEKPHVIAINEVRPKNLNNERTDEDYIINGYTLHSWPRDRGINVWTHESLDKSVSFPTDKQLYTEELESGLIQIRLKNGDNLTLACIYRSQNLSCKGNSEVNKLLKAAANRSSHVLLFGDFNFRRINWNINKCCDDLNGPEPAFLDAVSDSFLYQHVTEPTRCRGGDTPSLLDLVFTNEESMLGDLTYESPLGKSDHNVLCWKYYCYTDAAMPKPHKKWDKADFASMNEEMRHHNWKFMAPGGPVLDDQTQAENVEHIWSEIKEKLHSLTEKHVPTSDKKNQHWGDKGDFPTSPELQQLISEKNKAHRRWMRSLKWQDGSQHKMEYVKIRNKVVNMARMEKRKFEKSVAAKATKEDTKAFWRLCSKRLKTKRDVAPLPAIQTL